MRIARQHMHRFYFIAAHLEIQYFVRADLPFLNKTATADDDKKFPFTIVPMLPFGDAGFTDVYAELSAILLSLTVL